MPNRAVRRNSVVDLLAKVPVNKGSLLTGIENLLKTIESSESAVMIPTLLRDKCDFDAWELLFVAKILKASILGHVDLVEFYMNHIGMNSSQFAASQTYNQQQQQQQQQQQTNGVGNQQTNGNQTDSPLTNQSLSPSTVGNGRQSSPVLSPTGGLNHNPSILPSSAASPSHSTASSISSSNNTNGAQHQHQHQHQQSSSTLKSQSVASCWATANTTAASISSSSGSSSGFQSTETIQQQQESVSANEQVESLLTAAAASPIKPPQFVRQAQPPSLLQLTTTNNHINSVAAGFTNSTIEQLTNQLSNLQQIQNNNNNNNKLNGHQLDGALSISTTAANQQSVSSVTSSNQSTIGIGGGGGGGSSSNSSSSNGGINNTASTNSASSSQHTHMTAAVTPTSQHQHPHPPHAELRSSRSAGCLFRMNSGASSPRTPSTPYPQAETLANGQANGLPGDPSAPVKLLLQIEQLKLSISHVTNLLESVVELYKKSIDNIALA